MEDKSLLQRKLMSRTAILWFSFVPLAITNGILRESTYGKTMSEVAAHQLSTVFAVIAFLLLAYAVLHNTARKATAKQLLLSGFILVVMTVIFEFTFGHYVDGKSWTWLIQDYNIFKGNVWGLFLLTELFTPLFIKSTSRRLKTRQV